jgi:hypothetical protein
MCKAQALATPEILAVYTPSGKLSEFDCDLPSSGDLFVKLRFGQGSASTELLRRYGSGLRNNSGRDIRIGEYLIARAKAENKTFLVQPALRNDPVLDIPAGANLGTARLVTGLCNGSTVIPLFGSFTYFEGKNQNRYVTLIDVANGQLLPPLEFFSPSKRSTEFINFEERRILPRWNTVLQFTNTAHMACDDFVFIGWDVAFTEQGPMILEGNIDWAADDYQRISGKPLGLTMFSKILRLPLRAAAENPNGN